jgi:hypothetical protein
MALTCADLNAMPCTNPRCPGCSDGLRHLHPKCHPGRGLDVEYASGVLTLRCHRCTATVTQIAVALAPDLSTGSVQ